MVQTNIHLPTDATLLGDDLRKILSVTTSLAVVEKPCVPVRGAKQD